ncbi:MAG: sulfite exporter TauE/SafE family protein [Hyphomicrobiaceae bacterium]
MSAISGFGTVPLEPSALTFALAGALVAGFTTGFAGFGTGLVASGLWFHALPAAIVPLLVALSSVAAQLVGLATLRNTLAVRRALPMIAGGILGLPVGILALRAASPDVLRLTVGLFLVAYASLQLSGLSRSSIGNWGGRWADTAIGAAGGFLGGFCGLSRPVPIVWLQLRGGPVSDQRSVYQPFNLVILTFASAGMIAVGGVGREGLYIAALCLPATLLGAWLGARVYGLVSEAVFKRVVLALLLGSGLILVGQAVAR